MTLVVVTYFGVVFAVGVEPGPMLACIESLPARRLELAHAAATRGATIDGFEVQCVEPGGVVLIGGDA
ncbi:hypothetical protein [uncultured Tateyamaria sp.]|uniref:hypothetical protein n=1 Tax=uncultured Tateyamaria sp. TaxID=455651 RepID=UPI0026261178|nr:hypothetical protein [uncultured Tateyamaria sp.]